MGYRYVVGKSLASKVIPAVDAPQHIAFMRFVPEVAETAQVFATYSTSATILVLVRVEDGTWRVWGMGAACRARGTSSARTSIPLSSSSPVAAQPSWLTRIAESDPPVEVVWGSLDGPLRLAMVQSWLLDTRQAEDVDLQRDTLADQIAASNSTHPLFEEFYSWLVAGYQNVYSDIDGRPCLVGTTETVGVDLELVVSTSEEYVGSYSLGGSIPAHSFITRHVSDGNWGIAANARRLPVPGWPPTEQVIPGLLIDGE